MVFGGAIKSYKICFRFRCRFYLLEAAVVGDILALGHLAVDGEVNVVQPVAAVLIHNTLRLRKHSIVVRVFVPYKSKGGYSKEYATFTYLHIRKCTNMSVVKKILPAENTIPYVSIF